MSQPLQFLILTAAAWLNRQQGDAIEYLREENQILRGRNNQGLGNELLSGEPRPQSQGRTSDNTNESVDS